VLLGGARACRHFGGPGSGWSPTSPLTASICVTPTPADASRVARCSRRRARAKVIRDHMPCRR
jgi:hypothetical protein